PSALRLIRSGTGTGAAGHRTGTAGTAREWAARPRHQLLQQLGHLALVEDAVLVPVHLLEELLHGGDQLLLGNLAVLVGVDHLDELPRVERRHHPRAAEVERRLDALGLAVELRHDRLDALLDERFHLRAARRPAEAAETAEA